MHGGFSGGGGLGSGGRGGEFGGSQSKADISKLYVGHLAPHTTKEMLLPLFQPFGAVLQIDIIPDRDRNVACKGFAFVQMAEESAAHTAAAATNNLSFEGRSLEVRLKNASKSSGDRSAPPPREAVNEDAKLYVAYMPLHFTEEDLSALLRPYGLVQDCRVITDRETGRSRGFGFAQMMDPSQAQAAIAHLNGVLIPGEARQLVVRIAGAQGGTMGQGWGGGTMMGRSAPPMMSPVAGPGPGPGGYTPSYEPYHHQQHYGGYAGSAGYHHAPSAEAYAAAAAAVAAADPAGAAAAAAAGDPYAAYYTQVSARAVAAPPGIVSGGVDPTAAAASEAYPQYAAASFGGADLYAAYAAQAASYAAAAAQIEGGDEP